MSCRACQSPGSQLSNHAWHRAVTFQSNRQATTSMSVVAPTLKKPMLWCKTSSFQARPLRRVLGGVYLAAGTGHSDLGPGLQPLYGLGIRDAGRRTTGTRITGPCNEGMRACYSACLQVFCLPLIRLDLDRAVLPSDAVIRFFDIRRLLPKKAKARCWQTYQALDIVVVDDGSTDGSASSSVPEDRFLWREIAGHVSGILFYLRTRRE